MKIAIQGHPTRKKEVIQLLESLGGINKWGQTGRCTSCAYYIDTDGNIYSFGICGYCGDKKIYTLEEFEKEFPFKIGDIVSIKGVDKPHEIIALKWYTNKLCYKLDNGFHYDPKRLTTYEKMKKERNVTLTLDKAKEWYQKGGELKEVALQAYSEEELTKAELPKTWEEFCDNYPVKGNEAIISCDARIINCIGIEGKRSYQFKDIMPSKQSAKAHLAMIQLEQLRDCWRQGWKPTENETRYCIVHYPDGYSVIRCYFIGFLSFPTQEIAKEFLKCFKDLIEQAGDLI